MEIATMKYQFIEEIMQINNPDILLSLKDFLNKLKIKKEKILDLEQFAGIWNDEETSEIKEAIKDCEKVDINEW